MRLLMLGYHALRSNVSVNEIVGLFYVVALIPGACTPNNIDRSILTLSIDRSPRRPLAVCLSLQEEGLLAVLICIFYPSQRRYNEICRVLPHSSVCFLDTHSAMGLRFFVILITCQSSTGAHTS